MALADPPVLLLGVAPAPTWAVAHCLRRAGRTPLILAGAACAPLRWTGDCRRHMRWHARPGTAPQAAVLAQLRQLCDSAGVGNVMAADAVTTLLLAQAAQQADLPACAVPDLAILRAAADPWQLTRLFAAAGLPQPDSVRAEDAASLLACPLVYPVLTRPLAGPAGAAPQVHASRAALEKALARQRRIFPLLAQSLVRGRDVGATFLAHDGRLAACSVYRRTGRGERRFYASVRVRDYVARLAAACAYNGVGHLALRYDSLRDYYYALGLRPYFCPSLLYAERAGLNYPALLLRLEQAVKDPPAQPRAGRIRLGGAARLLAALVGSD